MTWTSAWPPFSPTNEMIYIFFLKNHQRRIHWSIVVIMLGNHGMKRSIFSIILGNLGYVYNPWYIRFISIAHEDDISNGNHLSIRHIPCSQMKMGNQNGRLI